MSVVTPITAFVHSFEFALLGRETTQSITYSIIGSILDYANSILPGISAHSKQHLERMQNLLARVIAGQYSGTFISSADLFASPYIGYRYSTESLSNSVPWYFVLFTIQLHSISHHSFTDAYRSSIGKSDHLWSESPVSASCKDHACFTGLQIRWYSHLELSPSRLENSR